jgi:hypothetical protein
MDATTLVAAAGVAIARAESAMARRVIFCGMVNRILHVRETL